MVHYEAIAAQPDRETVETVLRFRGPGITGLKPGVNGREEFQTFEGKLMATATLTVTNYQWQLW